MITFLAVILLIECLVLGVAIVAAYVVVQDILVKLDEYKKYAEAKKVELEAFVKEKQEFVNEKQAFVQDIENRIRNSRLGSFLNL